MTLENKSGINFSAAGMLQDKAMYPSVVHCAYYSCIQLMKHLCIHKMGMTANQINADRRAKNQKTHEYLIGKFYDYLRSNGKDFTEFHRNISQLKLMRERADYEEYEIKAGMSASSITFCKDITKQLRNDVR